MATETMDDALEEFEKALDEFEGIDEFADEDDPLMAEFEDELRDDTLADDDLLEDSFEEDAPATPEAVDLDFEEKPHREASSSKKPFLRSAILAVLVGTILGGGALWFVVESPEEWIVDFQQLLRFEFQEEWIADFQQLLRFEFQEEREEAPPLPLAELDEEFSSTTSEIFFPEFGGLGDLLVSERPQEISTVPQVEEALPPSSSIKKTRYFIQVARCLDQSCVEDFRLLLKDAGLPSRVKTITESTPVFEVLARPTFTAYQAAQWIQQINESYRRTGSAFRKNIGERYRISLGLYPDRNTANEIQSDLNLKFAGQLTFNVITVQQKTHYHLVRTGNFDSKEQADVLQKRLVEQFEQSQGIWVLTQNDAL